MNNRIYDQLIANRAEALEQMRNMMTGEALVGEQAELFADLKNKVTSFNEQIAAIEDAERFEASQMSKVEKAEAVNNEKAFENFVRFGDIRNIATTTTGGYTVPTKLSNKIEQKLGEDSIIMRIADVINVSGPMDIPVENAGVSAYWTAEGAATTVSDPTFSRLQLSPKKLTALVKVTEELLEDSAFDIEAYLAENAGRKFTEEIDKACFIGTQSGEPSGVVPNAAVGQTASATNSITYADIVALKNSVKSAYAGRGCWVVSAGALTQIMLLADAAGHYIYSSPREGVPQMIFGQPVYVSPDMDAVATGKKPVVYGDFHYYKVAQRKGLTVQRFNELYGENGIVGFRFVSRIDGGLALSEAVKSLKMA